MAPRFNGNVSFTVKGMANYFKKIRDGSRFCLEGRAKSQQDSSILTVTRFVDFIYNPEF
jgi:hypothetical protein